MAAHVALIGAALVAAGHDGAPAVGPAPGLLGLERGGGGGGGGEGDRIRYISLPPPPAFAPTPRAPAPVPPPDPVPTPSPPIPEPVTPQVVAVEPVDTTPTVAVAAADSAAARADGAPGSGAGAGVGAGTGPGEGGGQGGGVSGGIGSASGAARGGDGGRGVLPEPRQLVIPPPDPPKSLRGRTVAVTFFVTVDGRVARIDVQPAIADDKFARRFEETMRNYRFRPARAPDGSAVAGAVTMRFTFGS